jgi:hypothetical protein
MSIKQFQSIEVFKFYISYLRPSTLIVEFLLTDYIVAFSLFPHGTVMLLELDNNYGSKVVTSGFTLHFEVTLLDIYCK